MSSSALRVLGRLSAASRASSRSLARSSFQTPRRYMSASAGEGHGAQHASSDLPWQIGGGLVVAGGLGYVLAGGSKKDAHGAHHDPKEHKSEPPIQTSPAEPLKDSEGTEASVAEVKESLSQAEKSDAPKQAYEAEAKGESAPPAPKKTEASESKDSSKKSEEHEKKDAGKKDTESKESKPLESKQPAKKPESELAKGRKDEPTAVDQGEVSETIKKGEKPDAPKPAKAKTEGTA